MNNENFLQVLESLDQRVDELVQALKQTRQERDDLAQQLEKARQQNQHLSEQVSQQDGTRDEIRGKVESILRKMESLES